MPVSLPVFCLACTLFTILVVSLNEHKPFPIPIPTALALSVFAPVISSIMHRGACGVLDQLSEQPQQEEGGAQSPEQPQYQQPALSVQDTPVSEDGPFSVNENTPAGSDHPQSQESLGVSEVDAQFSDQSQRQFS